LSRRGYVDSSERIPPGWRVAHAERWPINNPAFPESFKIEEWRFRTHGEVDNPLKFTYEQFQKLPHVTKVLDHHCIDGWSYLGQSWDGVDISLVREMSGVRSSAKYMVFECFEAASQRFPMGQDILLADGQNGSPLSKAAGYPLRVVAPGEFGYKSRKRVRGIKFCPEREVDQLEESFSKAGLSDLYSAHVERANPWTVDNSERKKFLRGVFAADADELRQSKKQEYLDGNPKLLPSENLQEFEICKLDQLRQSPSGVKTVVNGSEILLVDFAGKILAVEPICTHLGSDLSQGRCNPDAGTIKCPLHGAVFDVATGKCLMGSMGCDGDAFPDIRKYKISVKQDAVFVDRKQDWGPIW
jgi:DMSO/TMAO reductase YedYZ molybdopterin-dependent catalytic subunit/nitrite reductase/ring-hydroxylating ferredoxin subunit